MLGLFTTFAASTIDQYKLEKELNDFGRFQHPNGGFYDKGREPNARDTMMGLYVTSTFATFADINIQNCHRFASTLRNRDGGCGLYPGQKSCVSATYYYYVTLSTFAPDSIDPATTVEFLKSVYDHSTGLFRESVDAQPSLAATYYAHMIISKLNDVDLTWVNNFAIRNYIADHLKDDHFVFEDIDPVEAQIYCNGIAKAVSFSTPGYRISQFLTKYIQNGIKGNFTLSQVARLALTMDSLDNEHLPASMLEWATLGESLEDIFYATVILTVTKDINRFVDIKLYAFDHENHAINLDKESVTIGQIIRPAAFVTILGRINPLFGVNVSMSIADETPINENLDMDRETGAYFGKHLTQISKLGTLSVDCGIWVNSILSNPLSMQKTAVTHISLPVSISVDASNSDEFTIPANGEVVPGTHFKGTVHGRLDDGLELEESTKASFSVFDSAGCLLHYDLQDFKGDIEFNYDLASNITIPNGQIKCTIEVGDGVNGIHSHKDFIYHYTTTMAASNISYNENLKLSDMLKVKIVPGVFQNGEFTSFSNPKLYSGERKDAAGEAFFPQPPAEAHKYAMLIKVGGVLVKRVDGEVRSKNDLIVEFESNIDENIDYATGFTLEFVFVAEDGVDVLLRCDEEILIEIPSAIIAEPTKALPTGTVEYGAALDVAFKVKDTKSEHYLAPGRAYPVLVLRNSGKVIAETQAFPTDNSDELAAKFIVDASIPNGECDLEVMIRKGRDLLPLPTKDAKTFVSKVSVTGNLQFKAEVVQHSEAIVVDYTCVFNGKELFGGNFEVNVITHDGQIAATVPLCSMYEANRFSWIPKKGGEFTLDLHRAGETGQALLQTKIAVQNKIVSWVNRLPVEGLALAAAFLLFAWAIKLRKEFRVVPLK